MKRVLLKLSGEALAGEQKRGFDEATVTEVAKQIKTIVDEGLQVGIVIGGGNFWRGRTSGAMDRSKADQIGMLATIMNCIYVSDICRYVGLKTEVFTPFVCGAFTTLYSKDAVEESFAEGKVVFFAGGTGHPYFSTDTATVLRAVEIGADAILLAKAVDGIYDSDPKVNPDAVKYDEISIQEVVDKKLAAMDLTASIMCLEQKMPMMVAMVLLGGIKRISSVSEKLVPFMALFYVVLGIGVVLLNVQRLPGVLQSIFEGAFNPAAFTGGIIGSLFVSMQKGVSRGIFSNEAGLGTSSIAHACADTQKPVTQGMFGIFEVFADTIIICTLTALVILCSGTPVTYGVAAGAELTISGFTTTYGSWSSIFTAVALCCFAFSTIIGWGLYGSRFVQFLFKSNKVVRPFLVLYSFVSILGATLDLGLLWDIADTFNGLMSIPNLIALLLLSGMVVKLTKEHFPGKGTVRKTGE